MGTPKVECRQGHEFTYENTAYTKKGWKKCRTCEREQQRKRRIKDRGPEREAARNAALARKAAAIEQTTVRLTLLRRSDTDWRDRAACATIGGDLWFPDKSERHVVDRAKKICATCPVAAMCLEEGMDEMYGVWGGTSPEERKKLRRQRSA